jgi:uncharacterized protein YjeT (DUF2065 family)
MKLFLYAISLICIAFGCCFILYTNQARNFVKNMFYKVDRKILSAFDVTMGILLLFSATATHHPWFIRLIGLLAVIEGGLIFLIPKNFYDEFTDWYANSASDDTYRLFGIISIVFGTAFLSWIL